MNHSALPFSLEPKTSIARRSSARSARICAASRRAVQASGLLQSGTHLWRTRQVLLAVLALFAVAVSVGLAQTINDDAGLTFYGWSDQHIDVSGDAAHVVPFVDAMNAMEGTPYPEKIGGKV